MPKVLVALEIITLLISSSFASLTFLSKWKDHKKSLRRRDYRIVPEHNGWTRTEIIATAGLLVAILGLVVALLRR
jgi:hypothetical protein